MLWAIGCYQWVNRRQQNLSDLKVSCLKRFPLPAFRRPPLLEIALQARENFHSQRLGFFDFLFFVVRSAHADADKNVAFAYSAPPKRFPDPECFLANPIDLLRRLRFLPLLLLAAAFFSYIFVM
jgi:hypothetical protein